MKNTNLAIQLYSVRQELATDFEGTLKKLHEIGFRGVELAFFYGGQEPQQLADTLKNCGMSAYGIYEKTDNLIKPDAMVYQYADKLNCKYLTMGFGLAELERDMDKCIESLNKAVKTAAGHGREICYHAHAHEFKRPDGGSSYLEILFDKTPGLLYEADTAWIHAGGENVVNHLRQYAGIIPMLHLKDLNAEGKITELGNGVIDFKPVVETALNSNIGVMSYEQDYSSIGALQSAKISFDHINALL